MEYKGLAVEEAARVVMKKIADMGGNISVIAVDKNGNITMPYSGEGMYRGYVREDGKTDVRIYEN
jgi:beta-aspartyl-peptidase (threonine type)